LDRVFLDANVLFSAAYALKSRMRELWELPDVEVLTSLYAVEEVQRNLAKKNPAAMPRLRDLIARLNLCIWQSSDLSLPQGIELAEKDAPILAAAVHAKASYLLTGDDHFAHLFGQTVSGVKILRPGRYLDFKRGMG